MSVDGTPASGDPTALSKDQLVLAMLAALGGERADINERDLFLACWHAFPNAMRWADTALPNPDTFTASLRRLDADGLIVRTGKQLRGKAKRPPRRAALEVGRSGVVKARLRPGALDKAGIGREQVRAVGQLAPRSEEYAAISPSSLVAIALSLRGNRVPDEGALLETVFHKFPGVFAYRYRPEFPDVQAIRAALTEALSRGLLAPDWTLTSAGHGEVEKLGLETKADASRSYTTGAFRLAARIEALPGFSLFHQTSSVRQTKGDELFRALRLPPTTDPRRIGAVLVSTSRELRRIDRPDLVAFLVALAELRNPDALEIATTIDPVAVGHQGAIQEGE